MKSLGLSGYALAIGAAAALLAGCGGSQPTIGAPGAMQQSRAVAGHAAHGGSWMLPGTSGGDLIYATGGCGGTCVLSYPGGKVVGSLGTGGGAGTCADNDGNIYVANQGTLLEFAHGGTTPINTYTLSDGSIAACSVDPITGDVAVAVFEASYDVGVFTSPSAPAMTYVVRNGAAYCGYDNEGNLFVDSSSPTITLDELPKNGSAFAPVSINKTLQGVAGNIQWDGSYLAVESRGVEGAAKVSRLKIAGSSATVVHTTKFKKIPKASLQSWIEGSQMFIPYNIRGDGQFITHIGVWKYPKGGKQIEKYDKFPGQPDFQ